MLTWHLFPTRNTNSISRTFNSTIAINTRDIAVLVKPSTGENIIGFPTTAGHVGRLRIVDIDPILVALELNTTGTLETKRDRLRTAAGLRIGAA